MGRGRQSIGANMLMSTGKPYHFGHLLQVSKISLQSLTLYTSFHDLMCIAMGRQPPGDKILMSTETSCHFGHLLQVSKEPLWCLVLYTFFHDFIHVYSPGAGADNPLGTKFWCQQEHLVTSVSCYKFKKSLFEAKQNRKHRKTLNFANDNLDLYKW